MNHERCSAQAAAGGTEPQALHHRRAQPARGCDRLGGPAAGLSPGDRVDLPLGGPGHGGPPSPARPVAAAERRRGPAAACSSGDRLLHGGVRLPGGAGAHAPPGGGEPGAGLAHRRGAGDDERAGCLGLCRIRPAGAGARESAALPLADRDDRGRRRDRRSLGGRMACRSARRGRVPGGPRGHVRLQCGGLLPASARALSRPGSWDAGRVAGPAAGYRRRGRVPGGPRGHVRLQCGGLLPASARALSRPGSWDAGRVAGPAAGYRRGAALRGLGPGAGHCARGQPGAGRLDCELRLRCGGPPA